MGLFATCFCLASPFSSDKKRDWHLTTQQILQQDAGYGFVNKSLFFGGCKETLSPIFIGLARLLLEDCDSAKEKEFLEWHDRHADVCFADSTAAHGSTRHKFIVQGLPRRPLLRELSDRLKWWSYQVHQRDSSQEPFDPAQEFMVPAECLGFEEQKCYEALLPPPPPRDANGICDWMRLAGDEGILRLLGMRSTVGSFADVDTNQRLLLVPPSRQTLLEAANELHSPKDPLTVAARARAKHAHRKQSADDKEQASFFGTTKGNSIQSNKDTQKVLDKILDEAVWINCHAFGALNEDSVVIELRVESGYGARWRQDMMGDRNDKRSSLGKIQFRGFLEPQMADGHEKRWRH